MIWDSITDDAFARIAKKAQELTDAFDATFSRFLPDSCVSSITETTGTVEVPTECTDMLRLYLQLHQASEGKLTPLIGHSISDAGYDAHYSLTPSSHIRPTPHLPDAIHILDDTHIEITTPVLLDFGALGKGYMVEMLAAYLSKQHVRHFLIDGSGDMLYRNTIDNEPIRVGLEHPSDATQAIGIFTLADGALCGSGNNRRAWKNYHHILDPSSLRSPTDVVATWVYADSATLADALATALFLVSPQTLQTHFAFEYCIINNHFQANVSNGFAKYAEIFSTH